MTFNPLPNKMLDVTKLKAFADDKCNVVKMTISLLIRVEMVWEKKKMLVTSPFPTVFSKAFFFKSHLKSVLYGKELSNELLVIYGPQVSMYFYKGHDIHIFHLSLLTLIHFIHFSRVC